MRTTIRGAWLTAFPDVAVNYCGFGTVLKLATYADPTAFLPDEVEDYISIRFKKVTLRISYTNMAYGTMSQPPFGNMDLMPCIYQCRPGDTVPTSYSAGKAVGTTIEENINSGISGDGPRGVVIGEKKNLRFKPFAYTSSNWYAAAYLAWNVDLTKIFQDLLIGYQQGYTLALDQYVLLYGEAGQTFALANTGDGDYWELDIEWDFKGSNGRTNPNANTKVNRATHPVIKVNPTQGGLPRKWYEVLFPWL